MTKHGAGCAPKRQKTWVGDMWKLLDRKVTWFGLLMLYGAMSALDAIDIILGAYVRAYYGN